MTPLRCPVTILSSPHWYYLDLRDRAVRGIHRLTKEGNFHIRKKVRGKRGRRRDANLTPAEEKERSALRVSKLNNWEPATALNPNQNIRKTRRAVKVCRNKVWDEMWTCYQERTPDQAKSPAQKWTCGPIGGRSTEDWPKQKILLLYRCEPEK